MDQMSFSEAEYRNKRKQTRREKFLAEMELATEPALNPLRVEHRVKINP